MLPRSGRVGTIYSSAAEVRERPVAAGPRGVLFNDIVPRLSILKSLAGKGIKTIYTELSRDRVDTAVQL